MPDAIGDTERAELGEIAVVKDQNKMGWFVAETLKHVSMAAWKGPDIAWFEVIRLGLTSRINDRCANTAFENERPFRCSRVPVKFAHHTGFKLHRHTGDSFGDGKLFNGRFLAEAVSGYFPLGFLQFEFETRQFFAGE